MQNSKCKPYAVGSSVVNVVTMFTALPRIGYGLNFEL